MVRSCASASCSTGVRRLQAERAPVGLCSTETVTYRRGARFRAAPRQGAASPPGRARRARAAPAAGACQRRQPRVFDRPARLVDQHRRPAWQRAGDDVQRVGGATVVTICSGRRDAVLHQPRRQRARRRRPRRPARHSAAHARPSWRSPCAARRRAGRGPASLRQRAQARAWAGRRAPGTCRGSAWWR